MTCGTGCGLLVGHKAPLKQRRRAADVATPTSCVFHVAVFGVPTGITLTLGIRGPILLGGLLPTLSLQVGFTVLLTV